MGTDLQDLVLGVVADYERDRDAVFGGRPESLDSVESGPLTQNAEDRPVRPREFDADAATEPPAERPTAMPEIAGRIVDRPQTLQGRSVVVTASSMTAPFFGKTRASADIVASGVSGRTFHSWAALACNCWRILRWVSPRSRPRFMAVSR